MYSSIRLVNEQTCCTHASAYELVISRIELPIHIDVTSVFCLVRLRCVSPVATCLKHQLHIDVEHTWRQSRLKDGRTLLLHPSD
jgi:hypothetical protein